MGTLLILCLFIVLGIIFFIDMYHSTEHYTVTEGARLREDAKIISIKRKDVGTKGNRRFQTEVLFNDGFIYISHKTDVDNHLFYYEISVSDEKNAEIINAAMKKHLEICKKVNKKR